MIERRAVFLMTGWAVLPLLGCGGGGPTTPPTPTPTPAPSEVFSVTGVVYDDENRNARRDDGESVWLPNVEVEIAGRTGRSEARTGRFRVDGVVRGAQVVTLRAPSLPPFYSPGTPVTVEVPQAAGELFVQAVLPPLGRNRAGVYFLSGDSIAQGVGSTSERGFRDGLQAKLQEFFGRGQVIYRGGGGGTTSDAQARLLRDLEGIEPAFTLAAWGTNDWYNLCPGGTCQTVENLRGFIRQVKAFGSLPAVSTIPPTNVAFGAGASEARNARVVTLNEGIKAMAREEGALVIDAHAAFIARGNLASLFADDVHPNDAGHELLAETYAQALTRGSLTR